MALQTQLGQYHLWTASYFSISSINKIRRESLPSLVVHFSASLLSLFIKAGQKTSRQRLSFQMSDLRQAKASYLSDLPVFLADYL